LVAALVVFEERRGKAGLGVARTKNTNKQGGNKGSS
jgi:hypothetical protein